MNRKILFVLSLSLVLLGCAPIVVDDDPICEEYSGPEPSCVGDPNAPHVTINTISLNVTPHCIRAKAGSTIIYHLVPHARNKVGSAEIFPKDAEDIWLAGVNDPDKDYIYIDVPHELEEGDHDYGIKTGDRCLDPRVHVEN